MATALIAIARLHPRPAEASKKALLARAGKLNSEETIGVFSNALDDPSFLAHSPSNLKVLMWKSNAVP